LIVQWGVCDAGESDSLRALDSEAAVKAASLLRKALLGRCVATAPILRLEEGVRSLGFNVSRTRLRPETGGAQAWLIPSGRMSFDLPLDPTPISGWRKARHENRSEVERHRSRFLIAHELAHSVFYEQRDDLSHPVRTNPYTPKEEQFCDECARWILVSRERVEQLSVTPSSIRTIHQEFDVSVELAARAFAAVKDMSVLLLYLTDENEWRVQWDSSGDMKAGTSFHGDSRSWSERFGGRFELIPRRGQAVLIGGA
jgi:hypothetical protein